MTLQVGQTIKGAKWCYRLTEALEKGVHRSKVFKAEVLPGLHHPIPAQCALIKTESPERKRFLRCEYEAYSRPSISQSRFFRSLYDIVGKAEDLQGDSSIDPPCLVLEWLDYTLAEVSSEQYGQNYTLLSAIAEATLSSLAAMNSHGLVHTDIKPDNILLSNIDTTRPIVKVGDLGLTTHDGFNEWPVQPYAMRAPEIWRGLGCTHRSDVWSFAITALDWYKGGIFGVRDNKDGHWHEPWCISKLMRLFPGWTGPPIDNAVIRGNFELGALFIEAPDPKNPEKLYIKTRSLDEELQGVNIPPEFARFLCRLLVVDPEERPSAAEALQLPEYQALLAKAVNV